MYLTPQLKKILKKKIKSRETYFDNSPIYIQEAFLFNQGLLIFYSVKNPFALGAVLFDNIKMQSELWRTANPVWKTDDKIKPQKIIYEQGDIYFSYIQKKATNIIKITQKDFLALQKINRRLHY